jgi:hypothetical protein
MATGATFIQRTTHFIDVRNQAIHFLGHFLFEALRVGAGDNILDAFFQFVAQVVEDGGQG